MESGKITKPFELGRQYGDACGAAHALDLVGERWALLVMREMMLGPKRFTDLRAGLPGLSANVLTQRLEKLEGVGIVQRRDLGPPAGNVYELTAWGYEAEPILSALGRWAARSPLHDPTLAFSTSSLILSLRTMFDASRAPGTAVRIGLVIGRETFLAEVAGDRLIATREALVAADATVHGHPSALAAMVYDIQPLVALEAAGAVRVEGDRAALARFTALFALPPKASVQGGA